MNTKLIMTVSASVMGAVGIALSFLPQEILNYLSQTGHSSIDVVVLQVLGALYFAFAMTNWTARANLIGGIYARPIAIGNFSHFVVGALALLKAYSSNHQAVLLIPMIVYTLFAIAFSVIFYTHPVKQEG